MIIRKMTSMLVSAALVTMIFSGCGGSSAQTTTAQTTAGQAASAETKAENKASAAAETEWPTKQVNFIIGFKAGGGADITARAVFKPYVEDILGQTFVINYMEGSNGEISYTQLAKATQPDGYTICWGAYPGFLTLPMTKETQFQLEDFQPVANLSNDPNVIVVPADSEFKTLEDLVNYCKDNPEKLTMGIGALGADDSLACEQFIRAANIKVNQIVYSEGTSERVTAILGGHLQAGIINASELAPYGDQIRVLGLMAKERLSFLPDVPTLIEQGYDVTNSVYRGILMPAGVDEAIVKKLSDAIGKALQDPACIETMENMNLIVDYIDYENYTAELYRMRDIYQEIIADIDFEQ